MDRNLDAFLAVARANTLTEASESIGLTQPSLTKRIANLEESIGTELFIRHRRGMTLTEAGHVFLRHAKRIEAEYRQCQEEVGIVGSAGLSVLRVGAGPLFHLNCIAGLFAQLKAEFPHLKLELSTDVNLPKSDLLNDGTLDVYMGVITEDHLDDSIHVKYVTQVEHGLVLQPDDPFAQRETLDPAELEGYNWVIFAVDPETERTIQDYFVPGTMNTSIIDVRTTSFNTGLQLVHEGNFVLSAPLQLASVINAAGLVIRPTIQGMPTRQAGIHFRQSALGYGVIQSVLQYFDAYVFDFQK